MNRGAAASVIELQYEETSKGLTWGTTEAMRESRLLTLEVYTDFASSSVELHKDSVGFFSKYEINRAIFV